MQKKLSEEELNLGIVLQDPYLFGLLFWKEELRLPPTVEQRVLLTDVSRKQLWCLGRKVVKTLACERDLMWHPVMHFLEPTNALYEAMFVTPRDAHLVPTRDRVFSKINQTPFFANLVREKNKSGGGSGVIETVNGFKWHFRIEGIMGTDENMAGIRAHVIIGDEMAFGGEVCHNSRIMTAYPDAIWKYCGVPNGVRDSPFFALDNNPKKNKGWSKHNYPTFINPLFQSPGSQAELEAAYGGRTTQGYITQVLGQWGEEASSSFPPGSIAMKPALPFKFVELSEQRILDNLERLSRVVPIPQVEAKSYVIGVDYGFSPDPTEIVVLYADDQTWHQLCRIRLVKVKAPNQAKFLHWLCGYLKKVVKLSTDNLSLIQILSDESQYGEQYKSICKFADPGGSTVVLGFDGIAMLDSEGKELKKRNKQYLTESLKDTFQAALVGSAHPHYLWVANDEFLIDAISSLTERKTQAGYVVYETSKAEQEHPKDALLYALDAVIASRDQIGTAFSDYLNGMGWAGNPLRPLHQEGEHTF